MADLKESTMPIGTPTHLRGLDSNKNGILVTMEELKNRNKIIIDYVRGNEGLYYADFKKLGSKLDGKSSVLLISQYTDDKINWSGIMGRMFITRGDDNSLLMANITDVICCRAYSNIELLTNHLGSYEVQARKCMYNNLKYLAIRFPHSPGAGICFNGIYSGNCVFMHVLETEVQWID